MTRLEAAQSWELELFCRLSERLGHAALIGLPRFASSYGGRGLHLTVAAILLLADRPRLFAARLTATLLALAVHKGLKRLVGRERPCERSGGPPQRVRIPDRGSFPSGHTLHAVLGTTVMTAASEPLAAGFAVAAGLIAISRVVLGVHYPSDVAAGGVLGLALGVAVLTLS